MIIKFDELREDWRTGDCHFYKSHEVEGETEEECFKKIYTGYIRPTRYCNDVRYKLQDSEQHDRFLKWKQHGVTFEMYYGNATVD